MQVLGSLSGVQSLSMAVGPLIFNNACKPQDIVCANDVSAGLSDILCAQTPS